MTGAYAGPAWAARRGATGRRGERQPRQAGAGRVSRSLTSLRCRPPRVGARRFQRVAAAISRERRPASAPVAATSASRTDRSSAFHGVARPSSERSVTAR